jgi:H+/Cl- antiporter ClcA
MNQEAGKWIIVAGIVLIVAGTIWYFFHDKLNWLGNLPGDFKVEKENFRFYFPLATMLLLSLLLNVIIWAVKKFF